MLAYCHVPGMREPLLVADEMYWVYTDELSEGPPRRTPPNLCTTAKNDATLFPSNLSQKTWFQF